MAKKRKQYVAHISKARSARAALKDLAIGFCANNDHLHLINTKHKRFERAGPSINNAIEKIRYKWVIYIAVMGRTELKQAYIKSEEITVPHEVFKTDINDIVAVHHTELRKSVPVKQLSNVGWLALPVYRDISEPELEEYFDMMGCWELLAPWQGEILGDSV